METAREMGEALEHVAQHEARTKLRGMRDFKMFMSGVYLVFVILFIALLTILDKKDILFALLSVVPMVVSYIVIKLNDYRIRKMWKKMALVHMEDDFCRVFPDWMP